MASPAPRRSPRPRKSRHKAFPSSAATLVRTVFDDPRACELLTRDKPLIAAESALVVAERGADTTIRAAIAMGQAEALGVLELTLAATLARLCACGDFVPSATDEIGVIVGIDDHLEIFRRNTHVFYRRALERLSC